MKRKYQLTPLVSGQMVAVHNCVEPAFVSEREGKNLYTVSYKGREIAHINRYMLAVLHHDGGGRFSFRDGAYNGSPIGPVNADHTF